MSLLGFKDIDIHNYLTEINFDVDTAKPKYLKIDVYKRWYKSGIYKEKDFINVATEMNYRPVDIKLMILEIKGQKE